RDPASPTRFPYTTLFRSFALPDDELAVAQRAERLHRNFMGYTTRPDVELIGLGMSAISELDGLYVQVRSKLVHWWKAMEQGEPRSEEHTSELQSRENLVS